MTAKITFYHLAFLFLPKCVLMYSLSTNKKNPDCHIKQIQKLKQNKSIISLYLHTEVLIKMRTVDYFTDKVNTLLWGTFHQQLQLFTTFLTVEVQLTFSCPSNINSDYFKWISKLNLTQDAGKLLIKQAKDNGRIYILPQITVSHLLDLSDIISSPIFSLPLKLTLDNFGKIMNGGIILELLIQWQKNEANLHVNQ